MADGIPRVYTINIRLTTDLSVLGQFGDTPDHCHSRRHLRRPTRRQFVGGNRMATMFADASKEKECEKVQNRG